jgi:hypothetical protein
MKRSILIFSLIIALLLTACGGGAPEVDSGQPATDGAAPAVNAAPKALGEQFTVNIGQTVTLEGRLTLPA